MQFQGAGEGSSPTPGYAHEPGPGAPLRYCDGAPRPGQSPGDTGDNDNNTVHCEELSIGNTEDVTNTVCCARGRPIIVEWERDARHSAGLSLVRCDALVCERDHTHRCCDVRMFERDNSNGRGGAQASHARFVLVKDSPPPALPPAR
ncbi:hypothetical protein EVAR_39944_1 [Eumeta japonica]|uniref:Uncharacterized protein n=1 Tax=Eumeta variegata TaxID=151549 RepID=A0A4C1X531_EUMVA|nr:hypothetical protein EVAR_39944_1 [Eumeta japonica]